MCFTTDRSCEMKIIVSSISLVRSLSKFKICAWIETSSAETGSSAMMSLGSTARARAMAMRCLWPPENSCGYFLINRAARPTFSINAPTAPARSVLGNLRCAWIASASIEYTVMRGLSEA